MKARSIEVPRWAGLLLVLSLLLAACSGEAAPADQPDGDATSTAEPDGSDTEEGEAAAPSGEPIRVGGSLALTGFLAPGALIHKTAGDLFVERLNASGGLLGRPVEWVVIDDESQPDRAAAAYDRLISEEGVDLITPPYGTGTVSAAIGVAERYGYVFPNHTGSLTYQYSYDCHFPSWSSGRYINETIITDLLDMLEETDTPPESLAFVVNEFPGSNYVAFGTQDGDERDQRGGIDIARERGYEVFEITYPVSISDWAPIAAEIKQRDPDFIVNPSVGLDAANLLQALEALDYQPDGQFSLWSAPGPLDGLGATADGVMLAGLYLPTMPQAQTDEVREIIAQYEERATANGTYPEFETQAASEWVAWEYLVQAVEATQSLEHDVLCEWLNNNTVTSELLGEISFTEENNYPANMSILAQLQGSEWQSVWPPEKRSADVIYPLP